MTPTRDASCPPAQADWCVRLLGRLEVATSSGEVVRFRSRTALSLLAYLLVSQDKEHSNEELEGLFWPESDGDRQAQNLRRAVADLRKVLETDTPLGSVIVTRKGRVSLNRDCFKTDVGRFHSLTSQAADEDEPARLSEAVSLYQGPLLAPLTDEWVVSHRMELEERFGQAVDRLSQILVGQGRAKEAISIGRTAVVTAPLREDIHIALISAYRSADMEVEAIRQFEDLERLLDVTWGEAPSARASEALERGIAETSVVASGDGCQPLIDTEQSGGAVPLASKFYVRRNADTEAEKHIDRRESVVLIQGPRQVGKSSLLARILDHARSTDLSVVLTDLQAMGGTQLDDEQRFYKSIAHGLAVQLGLSLDLHTAWSEWLGPNINLDTVIGGLLERSDKHVCWGIDEADVLFDRPYTNDFFGLLRSWHNRRALDPGGPWQKLTLVLTYATEAHLFISDLNQSPFNVGVRIALQDFDERELRELQGRYASVESEETWRAVHSITHGHPFLARCAFSFLAAGGTIGELTAKASQIDGPFGNHLQRVLVSISQDAEMLAEVRRMMRGEPFDGPTTRFRLQSAGLIVLAEGGEPSFRVPAYEDYVRAGLG